MEGTIIEILSNYKGHLNVELKSVKKKFKTFNKFYIPGSEFNINT